MRARTEIGAPAVASRAGRLVAALALLGLGVLAVQPAQADYLLQKGDKLRFAIAGLPESETLSAVDLDGSVHLPSLGSFKGDGKTLAELRREIGVEAAGEVISVFNASGERVEIALDGTEIFIEIAEYRPVYVSGDVAEPGRVEFRPGLTVRTAIASASGTSVVPDRFRTATLDGPNLQSQFRTLALDHAEATIRLWAIKALLERDLDRPGPDPTRLTIPQDVFEEMFAAERDRIEQVLLEYRRERAAIANRLDLLEMRLALLSESLANQQDALDLEDADLERLRDLEERGLTRTDRVSEARRALLLASTRLLSVEDSIAEFELQKQETEQQLEAAENAFEIPLMEERRQVAATIRETASQLAAARDTLQLYGLVSQQGGAAGGADMQIRLMRTADDETRMLTPDLDTSVQPGDAIDVTVRYEFADDVPFGLPDNAD